MNASPKGSERLAGGKRSATTGDRFKEMRMAPRRGAERNTCRACIPPGCRQDGRAFSSGSVGLAASTAGESLGTIRVPTCAASQAIGASNCHPPTRVFTITSSSRRSIAARQSTAVSRDAQQSTNEECRGNGAPFAFLIC